MSTDDMIRTVDLRVDYEDVHAVRDLNLRVPRGHVFGLIGPNGAGKTSTIRVLAGLQEPTYGDAFIGGIDITESPEEAHRIIGYMPDFAPVYDDLLVWELLDLFAAAYKLPTANRKRRIDECLEVTQLTEKRHAKCQGLSRGMKQRLILAKCMLHDPALLILDEPASGLDPMARIDLRKSLTDLAAAGKTVLISSHILTELSDFCTSIGIMDRGRMAVQGALEDVIRDLSPHKSLVIEVLPAFHEEAAGLIGRAAAQLGHAQDLRPEGGRYVLTFTGTDEDAAALLARLVGDGVRVKAFYEERMDVEDVFMKVSGGGRA